jgi:hypothetical protein
MQETEPSLATDDYFSNSRKTQLGSHKKAAAYQRETKDLERSYLSGKITKLQMKAKSSQGVHVLYLFSRYFLAFIL